MNKIMHDDLADQMAIGMALQELEFGDTLTIVDDKGQPVGVLTSLKHPDDAQTDSSRWQTEWDQLVLQITEAWQSPKTAVEELAESRR